MDGTSEQSVADSFQVFENTSPSQLESIVFDAEETSDSPFSELMPNQPKSNSMSGRTVKQYEEEMRVLKKENFNLKLRIYFLEERMQKLGKPLGEGDGAEKKLIELKVQMETLRRENQSKTVLLAQAGRAIEMMEEEHNAAMEKLRKDLESRPIASKPTENSMALYADAFDLPSSFLMPPPPPPAASVRNSKGKEQDSEALELMQKQIDDLEQKLQNVSEELVTSQERERQLTEALDSKTPEIQIKVQELCQKDKMLEDQRRIIVEIQIRLDEKQKELECLKQSLDLHQSTIFRIEADNRDLNAKLRESEEKQEASSLTIQTLIAKVKELHERRASAEKNLKSFKSDQIGEMHQEENEVRDQLEDSMHGARLLKFRLDKVLKLVKEVLESGWAKKEYSSILEDKLYDKGPGLPSINKTKLLVQLYETRRNLKKVRLSERLIDFFARAIQTVTAFRTSDVDEYPTRHEIFNYKKDIQNMFPEEPFIETLRQKLDLRTLYDPRLEDFILRLKGRDLLFTSLELFCLKILKVKHTLYQLKSPKRFSFSAELKKGMHLSEKDAEDLFALIRQGKKQAEYIVKLKNDLIEELNTAETVVLTFWYNEDAFGEKIYKELRSEKKELNDRKIMRNMPKLS